MFNFTQSVVVIGKIKDNTINMHGTGFIINNGKHIVTARHVVGDSSDNLVFLLPNIYNYNEYQDTSINQSNYVRVEIDKVDPFRDIAILSFKGKLTVNTCAIGNLDDVLVGDKTTIIGYPHCVEGRRVLTLQEAMVGAKILLNTEGIKSKYVVINTQTRPGQSGSIVYCPKNDKIVGMLIGAFAPNTGISLGGINPRELHQTTQCISAEYIKKMIE